MTRTTTGMSANQRRALELVEKLLAEELAEIAASLRDTAEGLRAWARNDGAGVSPWHAAKRLEQLADRVSAKPKT